MVVIKGWVIVIATPVQFLWIRVYPLEKESHNKGVDANIENICEAPKAYGHKSLKPLKEDYSSVG